MKSLMGTSTDLELRCSECNAGLSFSIELKLNGTLSMDVESCEECGEKRSEERATLEEALEELRGEIKDLREENEELSR